MDLLDRVAVPGADLLARVDAILTRAGAPTDHAVWRLMHRAGALSATVLAQAVALSAEDVRSVVAHVVDARDGVERSVDPVPFGLDTRGAAADGFVGRWSSLAPQISDDGLVGRLGATATAIDGIADWIVDLRRSIASEVGSCLGSSEAVMVRSCDEAPSPVEILAAADIAARVLGTFMDAIDDGWQRQNRWSRLAHQTPVVDPVSSLIPPANHIELR